MMFCRPHVSPCYSAPHLTTVTFFVLKRIYLIAASAWGQVELLICGKVFHYSKEICSCLMWFLATIYFVLLSAKLREKEGEKLGQQPWAHCCHTDSLCLSDSAHSPHVCGFYTLYQPLFTLIPPLCTPSVLISLHLSIHTISFAL